MPADRTTPRVSPRWVPLVAGLALLVWGLTQTGLIGYLKLDDVSAGDPARYAVVLGLLAVVLALGTGPAGPRWSGWPRVGMAVAVPAVIGVWLALRVNSFHEFPPFWDESFFAVEAHTGLVDPDRRWDALYDAKGPLFNWLAMLLMWAGAAPLDAVRLISAGSGLALLALLFFLGQRLGGRQVGVASAALYAMGPAFVVHDTIGVMDPFVASLTTAAVLLAIRLAERPTLLRAALLGLVMGLGMLTKLTAVFALLAAPVAGVLAQRRRPFFIGVLFAEVVALTTWQLERLSPVYEDAKRIASEAEGIAYRSPVDVLTAPWKYVPDAVHQYAQALESYLTPALLLALGLGVVAARRQRAGWVLGLAALAAGLLVALLTPVLWGRYVLPSLALLTPLAALGLVTFARMVSGGGRGPAIALVSMSVALLPLAVFDVRWAVQPPIPALPSAGDDVVYRTGSTSGAGWDRIAEVVRAETRRRPRSSLRYGTGTPWFLGVLMDDPRWLRPGRIARPQTFSVAEGEGRLVVAPWHRGAATPHMFLWESSRGPAPARAVDGLIRVAGLERPDGSAVLLYATQRTPTTRLGASKTP